MVGDGCSYLARELGCKTLIDAATLTGHASFTGKTHAAVMSNSAVLEARAVAAGLRSGEHCVPMVFLPEAQKMATSSAVADKTNVGPIGAGMGSAIGGYFIYAQVADIDCDWVHIDIGDPVRNFGVSGICTGYGVGLLATLVRDVLAAPAAKL